MNKQQIGIGFGIMCDSIQNQLRSQGFELSDEFVEYFEKCRNATQRLGFSGYLTDTETTKCFKKNVKRHYKKGKIFESGGIDNV